MKETIRVLIVDDDEDDYLLTSELLGDLREQHFEATWAGNFRQAFEQLSTGRFQIAFADFYLGAKTGLDLIEAAQAADLHTPIVLMTGRGDRRIDTEATRRGAVDYLVKSDLDAEKLERCIRYALERAATQRSLRESERHYRHLFNQLRELIFMVDERNCFSYINSNGAALLGWVASELMGQPLKAIFADADQYERLQAVLKKAHEINDFEAVLTTASGERRFCTIYATMQQSQHDQQHIQGIIHDITSRKRAEREALFTEKQAATARLVRTLAHEVRNPLTNINLSADQLTDELTDEDQKLYLDIIKRNSQRINGLISELLNSSRQKAVNLQAMPVSRVLDQTLELATDRIRLKDIQLIRTYDTTDCLIDVDAEKIKIALLNLVVNAIEAMTEGGQLHISTYEEQGRCMVAITDNGVGIPPQHIGRLFEPYFTAKNNGIGLGLSATLNIVQAHRATIDVESEIGHGTTFRISFPPVSAS